MEGFNITARRNALHRAWLIYFFAVWGALGVAGCYVTANKEPAAQKIATSAPAAQTAAKPSTPLATAKEPSPMAQGLRVQDLAIKEDLGQTTILVKFSQPVSQFRHFPLQQPSRIVLDIFGDAKQSTQVEIFRVDTHWVGTLRLNALEGSLRLTADIAAATVPPYTIAPDQGALKIVVGASDTKATAKKDVVLVKGGKRADVGVGDTTPTAVEQVQKPVTAAEPQVSTERRYTGQKISLEFKDADIKNVFRLLAEVSGKNIVVTDDVNKKVTVRLLEVPWDQAMDLLIDTNGLGKEEIGNVIRISTAAQLKKERDELLAAKKAEQNLESLQTAYLTVNYAKVVKGKDDAATDKDLVDKVKALLSPRGKVEADQRTNILIVRDIKSSVDEVQSLINRLDTRTPQVLIESNLIETTPTFSRTLGTEVDFSRGGAQVDSRFLAGEPFQGSLTSFDPNVKTTLNEGFRLGLFQNRFGPFRNLNVVLTAAEAEGNIKIISRPSIVTLNNIESSIEIGEVIRVKKSAATVGESGGIETFRAGIILTVTPQVSADGFVLLKMAVKASEFDFSKTVDNIPRETTREAKANVLVRGGETVVIGGILKDRGSQSETGIPYLKEIPVLGWLFKKSSWTKDFQELVVFITPRIIEAGSENLPTAERLWRNQLKQTEGSAPISASPKP